MACDSWSVGSSMVSRVESRLMWAPVSRAASSLVLAPNPATFEQGRIFNPGSPFRRSGFENRWRAIEDGYEVHPSDCPAIRFSSHYGYIAKAPVGGWIARQRTVALVRRFGRGWASFGHARVGGEQWVDSDSGFLASWIAGSQYVKLQTGLRIYYPANCVVYQGPIPRWASGAGDTKGIQAEVALEAPGARLITIAGARMGVCDLNAIVRLPNGLDRLVIPRGEPVLWFFLAPRKSSHITRL